MRLLLSGAESCSVRYAQCPACGAYFVRCSPGEAGGVPQWQHEPVPPPWVVDPDYLERLARSDGLV